MRYAGIDGWQLLVEGLAALAQTEYSDQQSFPVAYFVGSTCVAACPALPHHSAPLSEGDKDATLQTAPVL